MTEKEMISKMDKLIRQGLPREKEAYEFTQYNGYHPILMVRDFHQYLDEGADADWAFFLATGFNYSIFMEA